MRGAVQPSRAEEPVAIESSEIDRLRGENLALQSMLQGLCVALSQMSERHREVVIQACEYAKHRRVQEMNRGGQGELGTEAFDTVVAQLRAVIVDRYSAY